MLLPLNSRANAQKAKEVANTSKSVNESKSVDLSESKKRSAISQEPAKKHHSPPVVLILGYPGHGKSTFLNSMISDQKNLPLPALRGGSTLTRFPLTLHVGQHTEADILAAAAHIGKHFQDQALEYELGTNPKLTLVDTRGLDLTSDCDTLPAKSEIDSQFQPTVIVLRSWKRMPTMDQLQRVVHVAGKHLLTAKLIVSFEPPEKSDLFEQEELNLELLHRQFRFHLDLFLHNHGLTIDSSMLNQLLITPMSPATLRDCVLGTQAWPQPSLSSTLSAEISWDFPSTWTALPAAFETPADFTQLESPFKPDDTFIFHTPGKPLGLETYSQTYQQSQERLKSVFTRFLEHSNAELLNRLDSLSAEHSNLILGWVVQHGKEPWFRKGTSLTLANYNSLIGANAGVSKSETPADFAGLSDLPIARELRAIFTEHAVTSVCNATRSFVAYNCQVPYGRSVQFSCFH